jgi:hypothetical protein
MTKHAFDFAWFCVVELLPSVLIVVLTRKNPSTTKLRSGNNVHANAHGHTQEHLPFERVEGFYTDRHETLDSDTLQQSPYTMRYGAV